MYGCSMQETACFTYYAAVMPKTCQRFPALYGSRLPLLPMHDNAAPPNGHTSPLASPRVPAIAATTDLHRPNLLVYGALTLFNAAC